MWPVVDRVHRWPNHHNPCIGPLSTVFTDGRTTTILAYGPNRRPCSQMPEPPQSLHMARRRPCSHMAEPPQSLHWPVVDRVHRWPNHHNPCIGTESSTVFTDGGTTTILASGPNVDRVHTWMNHHNLYIWPVVDRVHRWPNHHNPCIGPVVDRVHRWHPPPQSSALGPSSTVFADACTTTRFTVIPGPVVFALVGDFGHENLIMNNLLITNLSKRE